MTVDVDGAVATLQRGGVVLLPTDTVYGIAALPSVTGATAALFRLKERAGDQPLAVLVADVEQALDLVVPPGEAARCLIDRFWPGPLTLVLRRSTAAANLELAGASTTIGVRCPDHPLVAELATRAGPIATTSANRHGEPTPSTAGLAGASLSGPVDLVIDGGELVGSASTVVDLSGDRPRVLREGEISATEIGQVVGEVLR